MYPVVCHVFSYHLSFLPYYNIITDYPILSHLTSHDWTTRAVAPGRLMGFVYIIFSHSKWCLVDGWVSFWGIISQGMIVIHELVSPGKPVLNQPGPNGMTEGNAVQALFVGWPWAAFYRVDSTYHKRIQGFPGAHVGYVGPASHVVGFSFHH